MINVVFKYQYSGVLSTSRFCLLFLTLSSQKLALAGHPNFIERISFEVGYEAFIYLRVPRQQRRPRENQLLLWRLSFRQWPRVRLFATCSRLYFLLWHRAILSAHASLNIEKSIGASDSYEKLLGHVPIRSMSLSLNPLFSTTLITASAKARPNWKFAWHSCCTVKEDPENILNMSSRSAAGHGIVSNANCLIPIGGIVFFALSSVCSWRISAIATVMPSAEVPL